MHTIGPHGVRDIHIQDGFEVDYSLDRFKELDASDIRAMSQNDARTLLERIKSEKVDGPASDLIYCSEYPPFAFIGLVIKAGFPTGSEVCHPTQDEMRAFLDCAMSRDEMISTATKITASSFNLRLLTKLIPQEKKSFLAEMEKFERENEDNDELDCVKGSRGGVLHLVQTDTDTARKY